jgi:hypothetical protein
VKKINTLYNCTGYPQLFESESTSYEQDESTSSESTSSESTSSESTSSESTSSESTSSESTSSESTSSELIQIDDIDVLEDKLVSSIRDHDTKKAEEIVTRIDELTLIGGNLQVYP